MKYLILFFFIIFNGCSLFSQFEQPKVIGDQKSSVQTVPSPTASPVSDLLPTSAKIANAVLSLDGCRLNFSKDDKVSSFDLGFKGVCGFERDPDKPSEPRIVKTPNGEVAAVIGIEKIENHTSTDKHDQPCNLKVRWMVVRDGEIFISAKTAEKSNTCLAQFDEKDYFIYSKDSVSFEQAEKNKKSLN